MEDAVSLRIGECLRGIAAKEQISILYACESGSRAWGFASDDSDYDVRFIYLQPTPCYLKLRRGRDVIERPITDSLDVTGWDLQKTLELFRKTNPPLLEWLQSPTRYLDRGDFAGRMLALLPRYYSPIACMHHYLRMAEDNLRVYLQADEGRVKECFYILRPVLACLWIEQGRGPAPTEFRALVDGVAPSRALRREIDRLLEVKMSTAESQRCPRSEVVVTFAREQLQRLAAVRLEMAETRERGLLDRLFLQVLLEVNGGTVENVHTCAGLLDTE